MKREIKSYLPVFNGFYNSLFEYDNEEQDIEYYNEMENTDLDFDDFEFDYKDYHNRVAVSCVSNIEQYLKHENLDIEIIFEELVSPREYNFTNDSINVTYRLNKATYNTLIKYLEDNIVEWNKYIKELYTSRDGFSSFYSNDGNDWIEDFKIAEDEDLTGTFGRLLEFYFENEGFTDEDLASNVSFENYIEFQVVEKH